ncbi:hypothetical protein [Moorena producens]
MAVPDSLNYSLFPVPCSLFPVPCSRSSPSDFFSKPYLGLAD